MNKLDKKIYMKKWRAGHKEEIIEYRKEYCINNKGKIRERYKRFHLNNPEYNKQYHREHKEQRKIWADEYKEYKREYDRIYCQEHISNRDKENYKQWRLENREKILMNSRSWRIENKKHCAEYSKKYLETETGKTVSQRARSKRRAMERNIINTLTFKEWLDILEEYNYRCAYCDIEFEVENMPTKDHVIPISKGGHNTKENVIPACRSCNAKKYNNIIMKKEKAVC